MIKFIAWLSRRHAVTQPRRPPRPERAPAEEDRPFGCGWFDSSHELQSGLMVHEGPSAEVLAAELPLGDWLEFHHTGWYAPRAA